MSHSASHPDYSIVKACIPFIERKDFYGAAVKIVLETMQNPARCHHIMTLLTTHFSDNKPAIDIEGELISAVTTSQEFLDQHNTYLKIFANQLIQCIELTPKLVEVKLGEAYGDICKYFQEKLAHNTRLQKEIQVELILAYTKQIISANPKLVEYDRQLNSVIQLKTVMQQYIIGSAPSSPKAGDKRPRSDAEHKGSEPPAKQRKLEDEKKIEKPIDVDISSLVASHLLAEPIQMKEAALIISHNIPADKRELFLNDFLKTFTEMMPQFKGKFQELKKKLLEQSTPSAKIEIRVPTDSILHRTNAINEYKAGRHIESANSLIKFLLVVNDAERDKVFIDFMQQLGGVTFSSNYREIIYYYFMMLSTGEKVINEISSLLQKTPQNLSILFLIQKHLSLILAGKRYGEFSSNKEILLRDFKEQWYRILDNRVSVSLNRNVDSLFSHYEKAIKDQSTEMAIVKTQSNRYIYQATHAFILKIEQQEKNIRFALDMTRDPQNALAKKLIKYIKSNKMLNEKLTDSNQFLDQCIQEAKDSEQNRDASGIIGQSQYQIIQLACFYLKLKLSVNIDQQDELFKLAFATIERLPADLRNNWFAFFCMLNLYYLVKNNRIDDSYRLLSKILDSKSDMTPCLVQYYLNELPAEQKEKYAILLKNQLLMPIPALNQDNFIDRLTFFLGRGEYVKSAVYFSSNRVSLKEAEEAKRTCALAFEGGVESNQLDQYLIETNKHKTCWDELTKNLLRPGIFDLDAVFHSIDSYLTSLPDQLRNQQSLKIFFSLVHEKIADYSIFTLSYLTANLFFIKLKTKLDNLISLPKVSSFSLLAQSEPSEVKVSIEEDCALALSYFQSKDYDEFAKHVQHMSEKCQNNNERIENLVSLREIIEEPGQYLDLIDKFLYKFQATIDKEGDEKMGLGFPEFKRI